MKMFIFNNLIIFLRYNTKLYLSYLSKGHIRIHVYNQFIEVNMYVTTCM